MSDRCITSEKLLAIAEARIAELEAENKAYFVALEGAKAAIIDLSQRAEQAEANWRTQKAATDAMQLDRARIAELQAELAALQTEHNAVAAKYKQKWQQAEAELAALKSAELSEHRLAREEAEAELATKEKECQEQFRQLLGAGETFNRMNAELAALKEDLKHLHSRWDYTQYWFANLYPVDWDRCQERYNTTKTGARAKEGGEE